MCKKITAFYDALVYSIISTPLIILSTLIFIEGKGFRRNTTWMVENWYLLVLFAVGVVIPILGIALLRYFQVENNYVYFHYLPFTTSWKKYGNNVDIRWNQEMNISEIKDVEIVRLTKDEIATKVFYKHWFNKYLKVNFKYGNPKYVYVGNYSNIQIKRIIGLLTSAEDD